MDHPSPLLRTEETVSIVPGPWCGVLVLSPACGTQEPSDQAHEESGSVERRSAISFSHQEKIAGILQFVKQIIQIGTL
jgi:hypothetical protein